MPKKIKILLVFLIFGTMVSILSWVDYFNQGIASIGQNIKKMVFNLDEGFLKVETDSDKDGLDDLDETYWNTDFQNPDTDGDSFLDGEEVVSGHDPTVAGPDDLLTNMNITNKLAQLTASGLYEGSLKPDSPNFKNAVNDLVDYATDNSTISLNKIISPGIIKSVEPTIANQDKYLNEIYEVIKNFTTSYGKELGGLQDHLYLISTNGFKDPAVVKYFTSHQETFAQIYENSKKISVPKNWQELHLSLLGEIKLAIESNRAIVDGQRDAVKAAMAFNYLFEILDHIPDWSNSFTKKNKSEKVNNELIESLSR